MQLVSLGQIYVAIMSGQLRSLVSNLHATENIVIRFDTNLV